MLQRTEGPDFRRPLLALACGVLLLAGCSRSTNNNVQAETSNTAEDAKAGVEKAADATRNAVSTAAEEAKPAIDKAASATGAAIETAREKSKPAMDKAAVEAQRGLGKLSHATGQALVKAGEDLQRTGADQQRKADEKDRQRADRPTGQ